MTRLAKCDFAPYFAEFVATFIFVFVGAGSIVSASYLNNFDGMAMAATIINIVKPCAAAIAMPSKLLK